MSFDKCIQSRNHHNRLIDMIFFFDHEVLSNPFALNTLSHPQAYSKKWIFDEQILVT